MVVSKKQLNQELKEQIIIFLDEKEKYVHEHKDVTESLVITFLKRLDNAKNHFQELYSQKSNIFYQDIPKIIKIVISEVNAIKHMTNSEERKEHD